MSPRVKGSTMRLVVTLTRAEREAQIVAQVEQGVQLPADIAKAMGCSQELVMFYARTMESIEVRREERAGKRAKNVLHMAQVTAS